MSFKTYETVIEPFFFGDPAKEMYGCHHKQVGEITPKPAVVICSPIGQEYIRSHRAVFQLASRLSQLGFHVFRFDYYGCGDSWGDFEEGSLELYADNISTAIRYAQERSAQEKICLIGLRIGGTLAFQATMSNLAVESVVAWEPILSGKQYLKEMVDSHREYVNHLLPITKRYFGKSSQPLEILGFPMKQNLIKELETIEPQTIQLRSDMDTILIYSRDIDGENECFREFQNIQKQVEIKLINDHQIWVERVYKRLIPFNTIKYIIKWVTTRNQ